MSNASRAGIVTQIRVSAESDNALIERIAAGDRLALRTLWLRHYNRVLRFVSRFVSDPATAEDIASDTFLDVWRQAARFEGRSAVATWMLSIARYKAMSATRRQSRCVPIDEIDSEPVEPATDPETLAVGIDAANLLRACVADLSARQARIIELVYYDDKPVAEIARILGIPANTVKSRAFKARKRLARKLAAAGLDRSVLAGMTGAA
jgi:RNA polymerase sigma-70 factor (ECF subfamily)